MLHDLLVSFVNRCIEDYFAVDSLASDGKPEWVALCFLSFFALDKRVLDLLPPEVVVVEPVLNFLL